MLLNKIVLRVWNTSGVRPHGAPQSKKALGTLSLTWQHSVTICGSLLCLLYTCAGMPVATVPTKIWTANANANYKRWAKRSLTSMCLSE